MAVSKRTVLAMEEGGWIRRMFEIGIELKQQYGEDKVFDLSLGNPVMEPPRELVAELRKVAQSNAPGMHRYMPNACYAETRAAVAQGLQKETVSPFTANEIVMTCGAAGALNVIFEAILNPGDEVIICAPFFGEFTFYIENHQGRPDTHQTLGQGFYPFRVVSKTLYLSSGKRRQVQMGCRNIDPYLNLVWVRHHYTSANWDCSVMPQPCRYGLLVQATVRVAGARELRM